MDKFGIFNILSSILGGNQSEKAGNPNTPDAPKPKYSSEESAAEKRAAFPPLQSSMLATMKNHDEFVKRVNANNKKQ